MTLRVEVTAVYFSCIRFRSRCVDEREVERTARREFTFPKREFFRSCGQRDQF